MTQVNPIRRLALVPIVLFAKLLTMMLKASNMGSGTALPGRLVNRYFPFAFRALICQIPNVVAITGTNGKTTTQTILSSILSQSMGPTVLQNKAGANLSQGIVSELLKQADFWGNLPFTHAVLEVEEATLPRIATLLKPKVIAVTNLYRDQLDAYGEIDVTEKYIRDGIAQCPETLAVVNGDDPRTARLTQGLPNVTHYVSLPPEYARFLPYEGSLRETSLPEVNILRAANITINEDLTTSFTAQGNIGAYPINHLQARLASLGFFHVYNALTAVAIAKLLNIPDNDIITGINTFTPAFGRGEALVKQQGSKQVTYRLLLVKNPASFSLNLNLLKHLQQLKLIIAINDNTADGKDVSWLWDSDLETLNQASIDWVICTGVRAQDMKVRLKYALDDQTQLSRIDALENLQTALDQSFEKAQSGETVFVMPTYTAMLKFRKLMGKTLTEIPN